MRASCGAIACLIAAMLVPSAVAQVPQGSPSVKVTLLGTGSPTLSAERMGPCTLVEAGGARLLFDAGRGCAIRLAQARVPWRDLTHVFLTHLHADHTFALPDLYDMGWILGRVDPLEVHGPTGTGEMMAAMIRAIEPDIASRLRSVLTRKPPSYRVTEIQSGVAYERSGIEVGDSINVQRFK